MQKGDGIFSYLLRRLAESPNAEGVVLFNGNNADAGSRRTCLDWIGIANQTAHSPVVGAAHDVPCKFP
jgi:hypothetical protein